MDNETKGKPAGGPSPQRHEAVEKDLEDHVKHPEGEFEHPTFPEGEDAEKERERRNGMDADPIYGDRTK